MKHPDHLTMADQSALNLLAKVTNKFCIFYPRFLKVEYGECPPLAPRYADSDNIRRGIGACRACGHNRFRQNQSWSVPEDGHAQKRCAIGGDTLPCEIHQQQC